MAKPSFIQTMKSVMAAFIGVQSHKNRESDFQEGAAWMFIVGGLLFTALFVGAIMLVVGKVLS